MPGQPRQHGWRERGDLTRAHSGSYPVATGRWPDRSRRIDSNFTIVEFSRVWFNRAKQTDMLRMKVMGRSATPIPALEKPLIVVLKSDGNWEILALRVKTTASKKTIAGQPNL